MLTVKVAARPCCFVVKADPRMPHEFTKIITILLKTAALLLELVVLISIGSSEVVVFTLFICRNICRVTNAPIYVR